MANSTQQRLFKTLKLFCNMLLYDVLVMISNQLNMVRFMTQGFYDPNFALCTFIFHFLNPFQRGTKWANQWERDATYAKRKASTWPIESERQSGMRTISKYPCHLFSPEFELTLIHLLLSLLRNVPLENYSGKQKVSPAIPGAQNPPLHQRPSASGNKCFTKWQGGGKPWPIVFTDCQS